MSRQVAWFETYTFVARLAANHGVIVDYTLIPGTPQWCGMADDDARKLLALLLGGVREALSHEARQDATVDASHEIASAADWSAVARRIGCRSGAYIPRKRS